MGDLGGGGAAFDIPYFWWYGMTFYGKMSKLSDKFRIKLVYWWGKIPPGGIIFTLFARATRAPLCKSHATPLYKGQSQDK